MLLKDDNKFTNLCLNTIRSIFTFLKNLQPAVTRHNEFFTWAKKSDLDRPVRFDTIKNNVQKELHKNLYNHKYNELMDQYYRDPNFMGKSNT